MPESKVKIPSSLVGKQKPKVKAEAKKSETAAKKTVKAFVAKTAVKTSVGKLALDVFGLTGEKVGTVSLPVEIFGVKANSNLLSQAVRVYQANLREGNAHTKTRGEVEGSTRKIYRQKGTGRARHGGIRAPLFVGGGIAFGPRTRDFRLKLPQKMRKAALFCALSSKFGDKQIMVIESANASGKTREFVKMFKAMQIAGKKNNNILFVMPEISEPTVRGVRNITGVEYLLANNLNALDVISHKYLVFQKNSIDVLKNTFLKEEK